MCMLLDRVFFLGIDSIFGKVFVCFFFIFQVQRNWKMMEKHVFDCFMTSTGKTLSFPLQAQFNCSL